MPLTISRHKKRYILPIIIFVFILMTTYSWLSKTFQTDELKRSAELSAELAILQRKANAENEVAAGFRRVIDYLKFDIEYYEWSALKWMLSDDSLHNVKQLAFEVHLFPPPFESEIEIV
ncbi:hypothetical protein MAR_003427 [Mya arenaria]|uniref:Uncharacterized protein n=1 Tax=Mya arenaria TaxID=6604 RepID=A0ABY7G914_MYAAR|nr:hypothetical protein MAR_003427 [Mya arenaria]